MAAASQSRFYFALAVMVCLPRTSWSAPTDPAPASPAAPPLAPGPDGDSMQPPPTAPTPDAPTNQPDPTPMPAPAAKPEGDAADKPEAPGSISQPVRPTDKQTSPPETTSGGDDISLEDWNRDDWMLVKPKVSLIDVDGYLRLRGNLLRRMDFGNGDQWEVNTQGQPLTRYPALSGGAADYTDTNMRLRIEPRINITEQIQVMSTVDFLDNIILGSTPDSLTPHILTTPVNLTSRSQLVPHRLENTITDAIAIKRVWGRVTALNEQLELRFGRMPDHWGIGMLYNNGDCLDCDWGTTVDRISIAFRAYNHVFVPMVDWISRGPAIRPFGFYDPKPIDANGLDDTMQYALRIYRDDHPDDIRDITAHGGQVFNYGLSNAFRVQAGEFGVAYYNNNGVGYDPSKPPTPATASSTATPWENRNGFLYIGDAYIRYYVENLEFNIEGAIMAGSFQDTLVAAESTQSALGGNLQTTQILQVGAAAELKYHLRGDYKGVGLSLKGGGASGDGHSGFGALDAADTQRGSGSGDLTLHNFQFSPDYHLDLLMFRRILGTVTDAWYVRPEVSYRFDDKLLGRINAVYSQAMKSSSTPSARGPAGSASTPMGVEFDGEVSYGIDTNLERGQFLAALAGGILFPLGAFNNPQVTEVSQQAGQFAWMIQLRMALTF